MLVMFDMFCGKDGCLTEDPYRPDEARPWEEREGHTYSLLGLATLSEIYIFFSSLCKHRLIRVCEEVFF